MNLKVVALLVLVSRGVIGSEEYDFSFANKSLLKGFDVGHLKYDILPGKKDVVVYINDYYLDNSKVNFKIYENEVVPCIDDSLVYKVQDYVDYYQRLDELLEVDLLDNCYLLSNTTVFSDISYDEEKFELKLYVSQIYFYDGFDSEFNVNLDVLEKSVNNIRVNYDVYSMLNSNNLMEDSGRLNIELFGNVGDWKVDSGVNFYLSGNDTSKYRDRAAISREVISFGSRLKIGELFTSGEYEGFGGIPMTGVSINTAKDMYKNDWFRYNPSISGIANSHAEVKVFQRNQLIYKELIPPGPFKIDNVVAPHYGNELRVLIVEESGTTQEFYLPYNRNSSMLGEGARKYSMNLGRYRNKTSEYLPFFLSGSYEAGFENFTLGGASLLNHEYANTSVLGGIDFGTLGGINSTVGLSVIEGKDNLSIGEEYKLEYSKFFSSLDTGLFISYVSSDSRYIDFENYVRSVDNDQSHNASREEYYLGLSKGYGSLTLNANYSYRVNYDKSEDDYVNLTVMYAAGNAMLSLVYNNLGEDSFVGQISFPFYINSSKYVDSAFYRSSYDSETELFGNSIDLGFSQGEQLTYNMSSEYYKHFGEKITSGDTYRIGASIDYSNYIGARTSHDKSNTSLSVYSNGGLLVTEDAFLFTPELGETSALIDTQGLKGVKLVGSRNMISSENGYLVVTHLNPYQENSIVLDDTYDNNSELIYTSRLVVPKKGDLIRINFEGNYGSKALVDIVDFDSTIGSVVYKDPAGLDFSGYVINNGLVYLTGVDSRKYNEFFILINKQNKCKFILPPFESDNWFKVKEVKCQD